MRKNDEFVVLKIANMRLTKILWPFLRSLKGWQLLPPWVVYKIQGEEKRRFLFPIHSINKVISAPIWAAHDAYFVLKKSGGPIFTAVGALVQCTSSPKSNIAILYV